MTSYSLSPEATYPYDCCCYIVDDINGVEYRASGVIIGPHTILTAAHVVWDATTSSIATNISVYPAYSGLVAPIGNGVTGGINVHFIPVADSNGVQSSYSSAYDFAVIDTAQTFSSWIGIEANFSGGTVNATGYPAYPDGVQFGAQSQQQWTTTGSVVTTSGNLFGDNFSGFFQNGTLSTSAGNSGGPLWIENGNGPAVVGIVSTISNDAQITSSSEKTISDWIAADSNLWQAQPDPSAAVINFVNQQNRVRAAAGDNYDVAGITTAAGANCVIGWESANLADGSSGVPRSAYNALVLDGPHSHYEVQVDATGQVVIKDISTGGSTSGQTIVDDGLSYILFNGGSTNPDGSFQSVYLIEGSTDAQIASLYAAALSREPDLPGLEYYATPVTQGTLTLHQAAMDFLASPEFLQDFPAASGAPDHGGANDQAFILQLYENVLHRAPGTSELAYYDAALQSTPSGPAAEDRADLLINFALSPENQQNISASTGGWLINSSLGGYADPGLLLDAATVLNQASANHYLNANLIDTTTIPSNGATSANFANLGNDLGGYTIYGGTSNATLGVYDSNSEIVLGGGVTNTVLTRAENDTVYASSNTYSIKIEFGSTATIYLENNTSTWILLEYQYGTEYSSATVYNFNPLYNKIDDNLQSTLAPSVVILEAGAGQQINGANINFAGDLTNYGTIETLYVLRLGSVNSGSAVDVAAAVNKVYTLAEQPLEKLEIIGQTTSGNTVIYDFGNNQSINPDTNGNHMVDPGELVYQATLVGVQVTSLTATDLRI